MNTQLMTYAEIDLKALAHNYRLLRSRIAPSARMAAVIKADAYGHGAVEAARVALEEGASYLVVARLNEALALRQAGISAPILLLGSVLSENVREAAAADITLSVNGIEDARRISVRLNGSVVKIHIKVDTGMGRLGLMFNAVKADVDEALRVVAAVSAMPGLETEGLYTHFASADAGENDLDSCRIQFENFSGLIRLLEENNLRPPICHCANSAATLRFPEMHLDMCRVGIIQYGLWPSEDVNHEIIDVRPVMTLRTHIIHLKEVPAGYPVSYGSTWKSTRPSVIATVAIGYADGYHRSLSNKGEMLYRGKRVPIAGRVCMDLTMLDVTDVPGASVGDEVTVWGCEEVCCLSADEVALRAGTIGYEMTACLTARVPRIYKR